MNNKLQRFLNRERVSLNTPTEEIKTKLMEFCVEHDIKWSEYRIINPTDDNNWSSYKENTCYTYYNFKWAAFYNGLDYNSIEADLAREDWEVLKLTLEDFE